ncbi:ATP-dependent helicase [Pseudomonas syringae pv. actinidiae]|uniref:UvrD-helicase domain-containing protein n=1 Tax=Pseudomonas syringae TaxID=317 RepID=UPI00034B4794|nr:UvrD-helicase domain-containing protein [Pseudomonas syringae]AYL18264.1 ATP-dependent helicase [Pseudomonas syringae pv. actinidiae]AYL83676.1 ATP-dependent helicase [Pseudomonas syringae pv. actinidiae str. Shaanxi_M228]MBL3602115.1 ATP-dependent helicase [Pseudomonas syringae pv. actinidiae]MBL3631452.1 ATP-dependent helicase [Pseudomonas syringae pv. actinidiae]MBL3660360.1 ATP-dependent helicase [Pseudomonas syringae pv. actinidiae]
MAETRLTLEPEVQEILKHIDNGNNFLLSGGAGSGKTYSLVQCIRQVLSEHLNCTIACMTYTNAAVTEIRSRVSNQRLQVGTIHEFLWDLIRPYKAELMDVLIRSLESEATGSIVNPNEDFDPCVLKGKEVQYKEYTLVREGIISHDELLIIAHEMFSSYPKLCDIAKDRYKFIFVDEYQDTSVAVIEIFLEHFQQGVKNNIVGFFGDAMQSIYDDGVGNLDKYIEQECVYEVKKEQNRRNPRLVFELANRLRTDDLEQVPSLDENAPNMLNGTVIEGEIKFIYTEGQDDNLQQVKDSLGWDFNHSKENKELNLTHNLIAPKAGFPELMLIYDGDKVFQYRDRIKSFIKAQKISTDFTDLTFEQVVNNLIATFPAQKANLLPTPGMQNFIDFNRDLYERALSEPYETFRRIYLSKDALIDDKKDNPDGTSRSGSKRDALIKHLFKIQHIVSLYENKQYNEFLKRTEFKIRSIDDKKKLKDIIDELRGISNSTIGTVIDRADELGLCRKDDKLSIFIARNSYVYDRVRKVTFLEFIKLYQYLEGHTPFSTQHKIKGAEFDNVLVVLDNGNWSKYNFKYLFEGAGNPSVLERTKKLFYVCSTRSKKSLVVYYRNPSEKALATARKWFGDASVSRMG